MAYDLARRDVSGKDWSCGIGSEPEPKAAIAAGAAVVGLCVAGLFVASSMGGRRGPSREMVAAFAPGAARRRFGR